MDEFDLTKLIIKATKQAAKKDRPWDQIKQDLVIKTYIKNGGNTNATCRELGLTRATVIYYRRRAGIMPPKAA